jgi:hypothetical protein
MHQKLADGLLLQKSFVIPYHHCGRCERKHRSFERAMEKYLKFNTNLQQSILGLRSCRLLLPEVRLRWWEGFRRILLQV